MKVVAVVFLLAYMLSLAIGAYGNCNLGIGHPSSDGPHAPAIR